MNNSSWIDEVRFFLDICVHVMHVLYLDPPFPVEKREVIRVRAWVLSQTCPLFEGIATHCLAWDH